MLIILPLIDFSVQWGTLFETNVQPQWNECEHSRHRTSLSDVPLSKDVQLDSERGRTSRNGSSLKRPAVSSSRPSSSNEITGGRSCRLASCTGRISTALCTQNLNPPSFARAAITKGSPDEPIRHFGFLYEEVVGYGYDRFEKRFVHEKCGCTTTIHYLRYSLLHKHNGIRVVKGIDEVLSLGIFLFSR